MSVSVHFNPGKFGDLKGGLQKHQERFNEDEAKRVKRTTLSYIDISETKNNVSLYVNPELKNYGNSVRKKLDNDIKKLNENLKANGKKAKRSNANTWMAGTFQISKDSLEELGYEHGKKWSEQLEQAQQNVKAVYANMVNGALKNRDNYGILQTATLHVDEGIPHVDFIATGVDPDDFNYSIRTVLNGSKNTRKGQKLSMIQQDLEDNLREELGDNMVDYFKLVKGDGSKSQSDEKAALIEYERDLKEREDTFKLKQENFEKWLKRKISEAKRQVEVYYDYKFAEYVQEKEGTWPDGDRILSYLADGKNYNERLELLQKANKWLFDKSKNDSSPGWSVDELKHAVEAYKASTGLDLDKGDDSPQFD